MMLDTLKNLFKKELQFSHVAHVLQQLNNLVGVFQVQFLKEDSSKNEAIDVLCNILQSYKDEPVCDKTKEG